MLVTLAVETTAVLLTEIEEHDEFKFNGKFFFD